MRLCKTLFVVGLLVVVSKAWAQDDLSKPWELSLRAGVSATDNRDAVADDKESNADLFIEPRADLKWRDGDRTSIDMFLAPQLKWHSNPRTTEEGGVQNDTELFGTVGLDAAHKITPRISAKIGDAFVYNDDPDISENGVTVRQNASHFVNTAYAGMSAYLLPTVVAEASGSTTAKRYKEDIVAADQDENIHDGRVSLGHLMGAGVKIYALGAYSIFENDATDRERGCSVITGDLGVEKTFTPDFVAGVAAGYQTADYKDSSLGSQDSANARAEINLRGASDTRFRIAGLYGFTSPNVRPYSLQKTTSFLGAIEHDLLPKRLTLELRAQYTQGDYESESSDLPGGKDDMTSVGVGAVYRINRNVSVNAGYNFETWDSDLRDSFDRNVVDVGVQARL